MKDYALIDLHTHTEYSNEPGCNDSVEDVLKDAQEIAERSGKDAMIAITDHNTILGIREARRILDSGLYPNVKLISGAEFTVDMNQINGVFGGHKVFGNCHILAYGFDENNPELINYSKNFESGKYGYYSFRELVDVMKRAGGKLVIAHPGLIKVCPKGLAGYNGPDIETQRQCYDAAREAQSNKTILRYIPNSKFVLKLFVERAMKLSGGIVVGMERFHPENYSHGFDKSIEAVCKEFGLIQTAGSDFHGYNLHTEFSVGNPFTEGFQEYYKKMLGDCIGYRNGIHVSYLPGLDALKGKEIPEEEKNSEIKFISGTGEDITREQYNELVGYYETELKKKNLENAGTERYKKYRPVKKSKKHNKNGGKHSGHKKKKQKFYYPEEDTYREEY